VKGWFSGGGRNPKALLADRYLLGEPIGAGAMAEVFIAHDKTLSRDVAVKILRSQYASEPEFLERFRREATLAGSMSHPNLVQVHDLGGLGTVAGDRPFIVMELLPGRTLADLIAKGPLAIDTAITLTIEVAAGMAFAHRRGLVHRDLKPQNILLSEEGHAKIADFGLAQAGTGSQFTQPGTVWGTVQYISPEQAQGEPAGPHSDIYSLGIILYELLVGRPPFEGDTPASIMMKHVYETPRSLGSIRSAFSGPLETLVTRALAKNPSARLESMEAFAIALKQLRLGSTRGDDAPPNITPRGGSDSATTRAVPVMRAGSGLGTNSRAERTEVQTGTAGWGTDGKPARGDTTRVVSTVGAGQRGGTNSPRPWSDPSGSGKSEAQGASKGRSTASQPQKRGMAVRTRVLIAGGILGFFALMAIGAFAARTFGSATLVATPIPLPTVPIVPPPPTPTQLPVIALATPSPATVLVPVVTGDTVARAQERLVALGLTMVQTEDWNKDVAAGMVAAQDPVAGAAIERGKPVALTVSRGAPRVTVPNMIGKTGTVAREEFIKLGLKVEVVEEFSTIASTGVVFDQQPRSGEVEASQTISIRVSRGRDQVKVPRVVGMVAEIARRTLEREGFRVSVSDEPFTGVDPDVVFAQEPQADSAADRGAAVQIRVRRIFGTPTSVPPGSTTPGSTTPGVTGTRTAGSPTTTPRPVSTPGAPSISTPFVGDSRLAPMATVAGTTGASPSPDPRLLQAYATMTGARPGPSTPAIPTVDARPLPSPSPTKP